MKKIKLIVPRFCVRVVALVFCQLSIYNVHTGLLGVALIDHDIFYSKKYELEHNRMIRT